MTKTLLLVLVLALLVGCGGWQSVHAPIASSLMEASSSGETILREARVESMRSGGQAARDSGGDDTAVRAAVEAAAAGFECPVAAFNVFAGRVHAYVRELVAALAEEREPDWSRIILDLSAALEGYRAADACTDLDLPALPALPEGWL